LPRGVRRPATKVSAPRKARAPTPRPAPAAARPVGFAKLRSVVFHASAYGAWPSIAELGLRTPAQLLAGAADGRLNTVRSRNIEFVHDSGRQVIIRDQRPMARAGIEAHLDGISLDDWLAVLNERVFFFARQKALSNLLARYQESEGQDVLVFNTAKLLRTAVGRVEVTPVNPSEPVSWTRCPCRSRATFVPIDDYRAAIDDIEEVTVIGGVDNVADLVVRVIRYHPDRTNEVLLG